VSRLIISRRTVAVNKAWKKAEFLENWAAELRAHNDCDLLREACELEQEADDLRVLFNNENAPCATAGAAS
jgi:hypothetical protein